MHGSGIWTDKHIHLLSQRRQSGQVGLTGQIDHPVTSSQLEDLFCVGFFRGAPGDHHASSQIATDGLQPAGKNWQGPALQGNRGPFKGMKTDQRALSNQRLKQLSCALAMVLANLQAHSRGTRLYPQDAHKIQQDFAPVTVTVAVFTAHGDFVGVEEAVGQPRVLTRANGNAGQKGEPGNLGVAPQDQSGVVFFSTQQAGPTQQGA